MRNGVVGISSIVHRSLRAIGLEIRRVHESRLSGTLPPHDQFSVIGKAENYFIHDGYKHRSDVRFFDDTGNTDGWQREVYKFAREVFDDKNLRNVCDIGCGSAYKLLRYFGTCDLIGLDVKPTCDWLRKKYPSHSWLELDFARPPVLQADLVVAADVVEHVLNPDNLLSFILALRPRYVVLSTPERNLMRAGTYNGPPLNGAHVREWSYAEFQAYIGSRFRVLEHFISNNLQSTQCLLCTPIG